MFGVVVGLLKENELVGFGTVNKILEHALVIKTDYKGRVDAVVIV